MMNDRVIAEINLSNLTHNINILRSKSTNLIVMVKGNAYGHGLCGIGKHIEQLNITIGVASMSEGVALRQAGVTSDIIVFSGFYSKQHELELIQHNLIPVVHSLYQISLLENYLKKASAHVWLKYNTGMNRLGFSKDDLLSAYEQLAAIKHIKINILTHLAEADLNDKQFTYYQVEQFNELLNKGNFHLSSCYNSAGTLAHPNNYHVNRSGIAAYGISTLENSALSQGLKPVMTLKSQIISIQRIKDGDYIGYNRTYKAPCKQTIAIIPVGYGDGYPQITPNGTPVLINGEIAPVCGRVSMDLMSVDISNIPSANIGSEVILFGDGLPAEDVAKSINISPYALVTCLTQRVPRVYI